MSKKEKKAKVKGKGLLADFKAFISRGNVLDMAIGVVIGGAFSAIVTAVVNILLSVVSWPLPGGLASLVTVLPVNPANEAQSGAQYVGQQFDAVDFTAKATEIGEKAGAADPVMYGTNILNSNYTKFGAKWVFNGSAYINWGALINAVISFIIIAIVLFAIVKTVAAINAKKAELEANAKEAYYQKHPEERPAPVEPGVPAPTETELLTQIRDLLAAKK